MTTGPGLWLELDAGLGDVTSSHPGVSVSSSHSVDSDSQLSVDSDSQLSDDSDSHEQDSDDSDSQSHGQLSSLCPFPAANARIVIRTANSSIEWSFIVFD